MIMLWYKKTNKNKKVAISADNSYVNLELLQLENMINQEGKKAGLSQVLC